MSDLRALIRKFQDRRVVVFGDLVADVFVYGEISRISREAPVLVLNHRTSDQIGYALDGAAAKQMAEALAKNAEVVLKHKALKQK